MLQIVATNFRMFLGECEESALADSDVVEVNEAFLLTEGMLPGADGQATRMHRLEAIVPSDPTPFTLKVPREQIVFIAAIEDTTDLAASYKSYKAACSGIVLPTDKDMGNLIHLK